MFRIAISNITGGRNRGCEALVASIAFGLSKQLSPAAVRLSLHTQDPVYDREQLAGFIDAVCPTSNLPPARWNPTLQRACYRAASWAKKAPARRWIPTSLADGLDADLIVASGGDIFTSDYRNFRSHARILNFGKPIALLAHTIGPFTKSDARLFFASTRHVAICTVRESETFEYLRQVAPQLQPQLTADVAFLLPATASEQARQLVEVDNRFPLDNRRLVGISVSAGLLTYRADIDAADYFSELAAFIDALNRANWSALLIPHVQEAWRGNNDVYACREVFRRVKLQAENAILYSPLSAADYKGIIGLCDALVGARMHTNIASMSQGIPTVAIAYSRKAWGIMRDYYGTALAQRITVDAAELNRDRLQCAFDHALANGRTASRAGEMCELAAQNFVRIRDFLQASR